MRLAVLAMLLLAGCGPVKAPPKRHFVVVVHSATTSPDSITLRWAVGGVYRGNETRTLEPGGWVAVVMGEDSPDLVEFDSIAFSTAYAPPDWGRHKVFHLVYPTRATWSDY